MNISTQQTNKNFFNVRRFSFGDDSEKYSAYLDEIAERSEWTPKTDVSVDDHLLMLVTCSYFYGNGRLLLVCRELRADETPESITALYQTP